MNFPRASAAGRGDNEAADPIGGDRNSGPRYERKEFEDRSRRSRENSFSRSGIVRAGNRPASAASAPTTDGESVYEVPNIWDLTRSERDVENEFRRRKALNDRILIRRN